MFGWITAAMASPASDAALRAVELGGFDEWRVVGDHDHGPRGSTVVLRPVLAGTPVDASAAVVLGPDGGVMRVRRDPVPSSRGPSVAVSEEIAVRAALATGSGASPRARLSWQEVGASLRLVWTVDMQVSASPGLRVPRVRVDAASGRVLGVLEGALHATPPPRANAYPQNPVVDGEPVQVELPWATTRLVDSEVEARHCRDEGATVDVEVESGVYPIRICTEAEADGAVNGDFLHDPVPSPADPARDEDRFAAPHTYWNTHQGLDWFAGLGWVPTTIDGNPAPPLIVTVNYRTPDWTSEQTATDPSAALAPYRNAYFSASYSEESSRMVFGQADPADFSYDADVIHHELGHYVVYTAVPFLFGDDGTYAPSVEGGALNEGLADYFSAAILEGARIGEYAGRDSDVGFIRDLALPSTCAADLHGEVHYDSLPFSSALWTVRSGLEPADREAFDRAVLEGIPELGFYGGFALAAKIFPSRVEDALSEEVGDELRAAFDANGVADCVPRVDVTPGDEPFRPFTQVPGSYEYQTKGAIPGYLQFRVEIPEGGAAVRLGYAQAKFLGFDLYPDELPVLGVVGARGDVIDWTREEIEQEIDGYTFLLDRWKASVDELGSPEVVGVALSESDPRYELHEHELEWWVPEAGPYTFQFTNREPIQATLYDLRVHVVPNLQELPDPSLRRSCGCQQGSGPIPWLAAALLVLGRRYRASS